MPDSEYLKDLKSTWGASCHSMWAELLSISIAETFVMARYAEIGNDTALDQIVYAPDVKGRLPTLRKDQYLSRVETYKDAVITNRVIILSASFELYLNNFIEAYMRNRPKFYDAGTSTRTPDGDKLYGETMKVRGLSPRVVKFAELAPFKIRSLMSSLTYLDDIYMLRNVLAHRAGLVDTYAASEFKHVPFRSGDRVTLSADVLMTLTAPVIRIAESLDQKLA